MSGTVSKYMYVAILCPAKENIGTWRLCFWWGTSISLTWSIFPNLLTQIVLHCTDFALKMRDFLRPSITSGSLLSTLDYFILSWWPVTVNKLQTEWFQFFQASQNPLKGSSWIIGLQYFRTNLWTKFQKKETGAFKIQNCFGIRGKSQFCVWVSKRGTMSSQRYLR